MAVFRCISRQLLGKRTNVELSPTCTSVLYSRLSGYVGQEYNQEKDPAPVFFNKEVQQSLKTLTRIKLEKVYRNRRSGEQKLEIPTYKFLTDDQLHSHLEDARRKLDDVLQMPPVLKIRERIDEVLQKEPALQGLDASKVVFTDITFGIKNSDRLIVVREPDGTLREADWPVRDRMHQVYFPIAGRKLKPPPMFQDVYLKNLLSNNEFEFILDRACTQFEPDDAEYQKITSVTYQYINDNNGFDLIRSTRHFGPFAFYLAWFKVIDNLLLELIETSYIDEANVLLQLYGKLHGVTFEMKDVENVERYVKEFSNKRAPLELALQSYKDLEKQRRELEEGVQKAHGLR